MSYVNLGGRRASGFEKVCSYSEEEPIRDGESGKTDGWRWQSPSNLFIFSRTRDSSFQMFSQLNFLLQLANETLHFKTCFQIPIFIVMIKLVNILIIIIKLVNIIIATFRK